MKTIRGLFYVTLALSLIACAPYKPGDPKSGVCNELNSQLIFSGATGNDRQAEIESSGQPLVQESYDKRCAK